MILGSVSFDPNENDSVILEHIRKSTDHEGLVFHPVASGNFTGGYYLHPGLPYSNADFCFFDEAGDIMVLLSGAIYNRAELFPLCDIADPVPDPELISSLFLKEGPGFVKRLNGDFAFLILQQGKKQAFLFRDHVGIRPMAYTTASQTIFFSSDIIGLCRAFSDGKAIDSDYLMGNFKYVDYRRTSSDEVKKLLPGHFLHFSSDEIELEKYWEPEKIRADTTLRHDQMLVDLKSVLAEAVKIRCDSRFRIGTHVSSGIDSAIVSALVRKEYVQQETVYGFSWSPADYVAADVNYDERELVEKLCLKSDILPIFSDMHRDNFTSIVSSFYYNHGYFSEDRTISQATDAGVNLIFSGWGGDEFVSTAAPAIEADLLRSLKLGLYLRRNQIGQPKKFVRNVVSYVLMPALGILDKYTVRSFRNDARYLKRPFRKSDRKAVRQFFFHSSRRGHHIGMLNFYHLQERCENWFIMGYRNGVEYRYPLLDKSIIEFMLKVPSQLLCKTDYFRPLLREISEGIIPEEIRWNWSKDDPVYWEWMYGLHKDAAVPFMEEVDAWRQNPDLHFVDFDLLAQDIAKYRDHSLKIDQKVLFRALIFLKAIHEFTLAYRK